MWVDHWWANSLTGGCNMGKTYIIKNTSQCQSQWSPKSVCEAQGCFIPDLNDSTSRLDAILSSIQDSYHFFRFVGSELKASMAAKGLQAPVVNNSHRVDAPQWSEPGRSEPICEMASALVGPEFPRRATPPMVGGNKGAYHPVRQRSCRMCF